MKGLRFILLFILLFARPLILQCQSEIISLYESGRSSSRPSGLKIVVYDDQTVFYRTSKGVVLKVKLEDSEFKDFMSHMKFSSFDSSDFSLANSQIHFSHATFTYLYFKQDSILRTVKEGSPISRLITKYKKTISNSLRETLKFLSAYTSRKAKIWKPDSITVELMRYPSDNAWAKYIYWPVDWPKADMNKIIIKHENSSTEYIKIRLPVTEWKKLTQLAACTRSSWDFDCGDELRFRIEDSSWDFYVYLELPDGVEVPIEGHPMGG